MCCNSRFLRLAKVKSSIRARPWAGDSSTRRGSVGAIRIRKRRGNDFAERDGPIWRKGTKEQRNKGFEVLFDGIDAADVVPTAATSGPGNRGLGPTPDCSQTLCSFVP